MNDDGTQTESTAPTGYLAWFRAVVSVLGARGFGAAAAFLGNMLVARQLESVALGQFYLLFTMMTIVAGLTGPAIDTSLVRFAARHIEPGKDTSLPYFKVVFYTKCAILLLTMGVGFAATGPILRAFFVQDTPEVQTLPAYVVALAFFGGAVVSMWGFAQSYFQAYQKFTHYAGYEFCSSMLRLSLVFILLGIGCRNVVLYLAAYVCAPLVMGLISWTQLPRALFTTRTDFAIALELFQFAKWVIFASICTTLTQRMDLLLLNFERFEIPKTTVGHYSAAIIIVLAGELVLLTFYSVLLPKASQLKSPGELRRFIGQFRLPTLFFCLAMGCTILFAPWFVKTALGPSYVGADAYYTVLLLGLIVALACCPAVTALYSLGHSRLIAVFEGIRLILTLGAGLYVVPRFGAYGMAWTTAGSRAAVSVAVYLIAHQRVKRLTIREWKGEG